MRFVEVHLPSPRPASLARFYSETLDLPVEENTIRTLGTLLVLEPGTPSSPLHFAFNVPENQIEDARSWLGSRVGPSADDGWEIFDFRNWNAHALYFRDADGNIVELIARHDLANSSDSPFDGASILEVSEVGVPTTDVPGVVATLRRELDAELYDGDGVQFAAVGDPHGLFIVVPDSRGWIPVGIPGHDAPTRVVVAGAGEGAFRLPGTACEVDLVSP